MIAVLGVVSAVGVGMITTLGIVIVKLMDMKKTQTATAVDAAEARRLSARTDDSINHRGTPLSDRLDDVGAAVKEAHKAVAAVAEKLAAQGIEQAAQGVELREQRKDILGIREDNAATRKEIGLIQGAERDTREVVAEHIKDTAPLLPMLKELHKQYTPRTRRR